MQSNDTNFKSYILTQRWFKATLTSCVWVLLFVLLMGQLSSQLQKKYHPHTIIKSTLDFSINKSECASEIIPIQIPLDPSQHAMGECSLTDDEINDDFDDHFASSLMYDIPEDIYQAAYVANFSIVANTYRKVTSIPLFILYHAWKSNLA